MSLHTIWIVVTPHATEKECLVLMFHWNLCGPACACTVTDAEYSQPHPPSLHLQDFQSKELPNSRIQPDRRWFGNTRVVGQKQLEQFRTEMSTKVGSALMATNLQTNSSSWELPNCWWMCTRQAARRQDQHQG